MDIDSTGIIIHQVVSTIFTISSIVLIIRTINGLRKGKPYTNFDRNNAVVLLITSYIQLVAGLILYFSLDSGTIGATTLEEATRAMKTRFWAMEHFIVMLFALLLSQLGWIFISKSKLNKNKHKNALFYFGISILIVFINIGISIISRK